MTIEKDPFFPEHHRPGLFRSRAWLTAWKKHWGDVDTITPLFVDTENPQFSLYTLREKIKGILPVRSAFPLGISTAGARSIRSEYFCFAEQEIDSEAAITRYLKNLLSEKSWGQFILPDFLTSSNEYPLLLQQAEHAGLKIVERQRDRTYGISFKSICFDDYLASLGKNTRLKLFNRRKNLQTLGEVRLENLYPDQDRFFEKLNEFHQLRWHKPCFDGRQLAFAKGLAIELNKAGHEVICSALFVNDEMVSGMFDVRVNGRQYNIQSGYLEDYARNISLGTLHLGYQIESAFDHPDMEYYDFMAGTGKNNDYKSAIANRTDEFVTLVLVRNPLLKLAYHFRPKNK